MRAALPALLLSCALLLASSIAIDARAEFCNCADTTFTWRGCDASSCDPAGWTGCTPSPDDNFGIQSGCHVVVEAGDDLLLEQPNPARTVVQAGGSFTARGPVEVRVGWNGFLAAPGSRVELAGCFRRFAGAPACVADLGDAEIAPAGDVRPCRDGLCDGDAHLVRLAYPPDSYGDVSAFVGSLDAARDVLCFWQRNEQGYVGADSGHCYKVVATGDEDGVPYLDFDVRQVWRSQSDQPGYPLARREVQQGSLLGDHAAGAREIRLRETGVVTTRTDQMGRWVRCGGDQRAYLIALVRDEPGGDVLVLADDRGLAQAYGDSETCHVDWGWSAGDLAFVMAPVHVTSTTNLDNEVWMRLEGTSSLRAVVVDGLGGNPGTGRGALQIVNGPLERLEHVWITDPRVRDREALFLDDLSCGASVHHLAVTGGPSTASYDKNYGLMWYGGAACTYSLSHFYTRFAGDDQFVLDSLGGDPVGGLVLRYLHGGPSSAPGDSGQLLDLGVANPTVIDAADVLCTACTSQDGVGPLLYPAQGGGTLSRVLWVGAFNGGAIGNVAGVGFGDPRFFDFALVGAAVDPNIAGGRTPLTGLDTERFYVRDLVDPRAPSSQLCMNQSAKTERLRNGVFARVRTGSVPCQPPPDALLSDVYFVDVGRQGTSGPLLQVASGMELERITMAFSAPLAGLTRGIDVTAGAASLVLDGPLLTGFRGAGVLGALRTGSATTAAQIQWGAPACFFDNQVDDAEDAIAAYGVAPLRGIDPQFFSPSTGRFDLVTTSPARAAGCGASEAGIKNTNWAHRKAKLKPLYMGPRPPACGLGGPELAGLLLLLLARRRSRG